jgi:UDP-N-acetylglucosamine 2-epimerase
MAVYGTRPEVIKMAPVVHALQAGGQCQIRTCCTGQHREMIDAIAPVLGLEHDYDLQIIRRNQDLAALTATAIGALDGVIGDWKPDWVLVQGDTTSSTAAAIVGFYRRIRIGHVEAGLRTGDIYSPWPEEFNRRVTSIVAHRHYAPTDRARQNLLREGVPPGDILVTGNTVIDTLLTAVDRIEADPSLRERLSRHLPEIHGNERIVLVTGHRRESFGAGFEGICAALARLAQREDLRIVYPVHLNPNVREPVFRRLGSLPRVTLCAPLDYLDFVFLMMRSHLILTDSGGIQEEAPSLGKPVLVMRETSERGEAIEAGVAELVGTDPDTIVAAVTRLLDDASAYSTRTNRVNPFGNGTAGLQIAEDLLNVR